MRKGRRGGARASGPRTERPSARSSLLLVGSMVGSLLASASLAASLTGCGGARPAPPPPAPLSRDAYAHYLAGKAALFDEDYPAAVSHLRAAATADPDQPELAVALILALAAAEDFAAAHLEAKRALERWPQLPVVWRAQGELLATEKRYLEASEAFRRAVSLDPDDEEAHVGLISSLQHLDPNGGGAAVLEAGRQLIARVPDSASGHYLLGQLHRQRDERDLAIAELRTVLRLSPGHLDARSLLAEELHAAGRTAEAVAEARSAFDRSGEDVSFVAPLLGLLCASGDRPAALDLLGLYDDAERSFADLDTVARLSLSIEELPLAQSLLRRMVERGGVESAAATDEEGDEARELRRERSAAISLLRADLFAARLSSPWAPPALRCEPANR